MPVCQPGTSVTCPTRAAKHLGRPLLGYSHNTVQQDLPAPYLPSDWLSRTGLQAKAFFAFSFNTRKTELSCKLLSALSSDSRACTAENLNIHKGVFARHSQFAKNPFQPQNLKSFFFCRIGDSGASFLRPYPLKNLYSALHFKHRHIQKFIN